MNAFRTGALSAAAMIASASLFSVGAWAADVDAVPAVSVSYEGLDLSTKQGAQILYTRLQGAARQVCSDFDGRELSRRAKWRACYNDALSRAVSQVNQATVTNLHQHATQGARA